MHNFSIISLKSGFKQTVSWNKYFAENRIQIIRANAENDMKFNYTIDLNFLRPNGSLNVNPVRKFNYRNCDVIYQQSS